MSLQSTSRPAIRGRVLARIPASLAATNGFKVTKANGIWTIEPDFSQLSVVTVLDDPEDKQFWAYDPLTGDYVVISIQALLDNLPEGPEGDPGSLMFVQNAAPSTDNPPGSLWIDADSVDQDLYQLIAGVWTDTGLNVKGATGATGPAGTISGAPDGTLGAPGIAFAAETGSGIRRAAAGDVRHTILGVDRLKLTAAGIDITGTLTVSGAATFTTPLAAAALASDSVVTAKILDGNVTFAKLATAALATAAEYRSKTASKILTADKVFDAAAYVALTDGATVTPDLATGINFTWAMAGNRALAMMTNLKEGQCGKIVITHTGAARVLTQNAAYVTAGGTDIVLSTSGAGVIDHLFYECIAGGLVKLSIEKDIKA